MMHSDIFKEFKIDVKKCHKIRGIYICQTNKGKKQIEISKYRPQQIEREYQIKEHLIENDFTCLYQLHINDKGTPYVRYRNQIYVMTDYIEGKAIDFYNREDIMKAIKVLASLHKAGQGFNTASQDISLVKIKNLGDSYSKRYRETTRLRKRIENTSRKTDFELMYLKESYIYQDLQEKAKEFINADSYGKLINRTIINKNIGHRDYAYHNIIKGAKGDLIITGFQKSNYDVQIRDLVYIIKRIMKRNQWNTVLLFDILEEYNKKRPISLEEWKVIKGMIIFPESFAKLCNQYFNSRRRWNYPMYERKFTKMLSNKDDYIKAVNKITKW